MRKYFLIVAGLASFQSSFSQDDYSKKIYREFDSLKNILSTLKGPNKVDCLNALASKATDLPLGSWQVEADTSRPYAIQANKEAKRMGYKKGLGDSYVNLETIDCMMFGTYAQGQRRFDNATFNSAQQNAKNAISIGEELKDYKMLGEAYYVLSWLVGETRNTGNQERYMASNLEYLKKAIENYSKTDNKTRLARCYEQWFYLQKNTDADFEIRAEAMKKAILLNRETGDKERESFGCTNLAENYLQMGDFENGFIYSKRSIEIAEEGARTESPAHWRGYSYLNAFVLMSGIYAAAGDYETALQYNHRAHDFAEPNDSFFLTVLSIQLGAIYQLMGNYDSASYYLMPIENSPEWTGRIGWGGKLRLIDLYFSLKQYDKTLPMLFKMAEKTRDLIANSNDRFAIGILAKIYTDASKVYLEKKDYKTALKYATDGLKLSTDTKRRQVIIENYQIHSDIFYKLGKYDSAFYYLKQYTILRDSLLNRQFYWRLNSYKKEAEEERKTSQINLLNKENQIKEQELKQQATLKNSLIIVLLLLLLLGIFIFRNLSLKRKNETLRLQKDFELQQMENEKKQAELHQRAIELEMQALRAQMNPHFIFNCLSSINRFIFKGDNKAASDYLTRFSRLIRMVLMHSSKKLITLEDELEMLRLYLDLERLRFKDAFDYSITTTNIVDAGVIFIPPLLLQPFCENAVWHGLMHKESKGHLNIIISEVKNENEKVLHCVIEDDGVGREKAAEMKSKSAESEKSLGLKITTERLALLNQENNFSTFYKIEDILNENNEVAGTRVQLKIRHKESIEEFA
jgi:hypothetical protein